MIYAHYDYIHLLYTYFTVTNHCITLLLCSKSPILIWLRETLLHFCTSQLHWVRSLLGCCSRCIWNCKKGQICYFDHWVSNQGLSLFLDQSRAFLYGQMCHNRVADRLTWWSCQFSSHLKYETKTFYHYCLWLQPCCQVPWSLRIVCFILGHKWLAGVISDQDKVTCIDVWIGDWPLIFYDTLSGQLEVVNLWLVDVWHCLKVQNQLLYPHIPKFGRN